MRRGREGPIGQRPQSQGETCAEWGRQSLPGRLGAGVREGKSVTPATSREPRWMEQTS